MIYNDLKYCSLELAPPAIFIYFFFFSIERVVESCWIEWPFSLSLSAYITFWDCSIWSIGDLIVNLYELVQSHTVLMICCCPADRFTV